MGYADLHIHSQASDGTFTPEEIVRRAKRNGATLISVCDHNVISGTMAAAPIAAQAGIGYICGAEIDGILNGTDVHILCYGADFADANLGAVLRHARQVLDDMSTNLLRRMLRDYPCLSTEEYDLLPHDPNQGGWKMLQYLKQKRIVPALRDAFAFYDRYGVTYAEAGFENVAQVIEAIHAARGTAILAHPLVTFPTDSIHALLQTVCGAMELGFDGVECDHPAQPRGVSRHLRELCAAKGWRVTAGSDSHGAFNHREIACTQTLETDICL